MEDQDPTKEVKEHFKLRKLQERVWRLESENKELKVNNSILQTQYTSQCQTQSDMLRTLHANLESNHTTISESKEEIERLELLLEDQKQKFKDMLDEERAQWENQVASLQLRNEELENKLNEVRQFELNKENMEAELASLKRQLQDQAEAHQNEISAFDRKKAIDIDQLKKDMQMRIKETREMLKARTKDQLDSTTKRTIMENEQMATELHFQSKETERLLDRNQSLLDENAQLRRNLQIHKDLENELARRTHIYQRLLKKMDQKQKADAMASESMELDTSKITGSGHADEDRSLAGNSGELGMGSNVPSEDFARLQNQLEEQQSTLQMVRHEFMQYRRDHATLTQLQDQSTRLIISALYELKNQKEQNPFPPITYDPDADWQFANMTVRQKEYFFRVLLEKLNSSMCGNCFQAGHGQNASTTSLPQIGGAQSKEGNHNFSQFLWSVASHGGVPPMQGPPSDRREVAVKSCQTETAPSDPCLKEGLWNPKSKVKNASGPVSPNIVIGGVRNWGQKSVTQRNRGL